MTMRSSQRLADELRKAGFEMLALRAEQDDFHDFKSQWAYPTMELVNQLSMEADITDKVELKEAALTLRLRVMDGEFDAPREEMVKI